ncbi:sugar phosphate isomerase/epimerase family protein [Natronosalvus vescus]|uniref:sugar phosphate isomerase/epimerase family protein n=1 Tax=Natronosalvus vescus TaxID=2953881 RepID=UPI00209046D3|nr:TIM barrel protein [Natronosalvus vescus]
MIARVGATTLEGVEFAGLDETPPETVVDVLVQSSLEPIGAHVDLARLENDYETVVDTYDTIGCRRLIVADRNVEAFTSFADVERLADRMNQVSRRLSADGFDLVYHNDMIEFERIGGELAYDVFVDALDDDVALEIDTGLAQYAGVNPIGMLERYTDRVELVHLTDSVPGTGATVNVELGAGELDVEACVEAARAAGVEWMVYEHSKTSDPTDSLAHAESRLSMLCHGPDDSTAAGTAHSTD